MVTVYGVDAASQPRFDRYITLALDFQSENSLRDISIFDDCFKLMYTYAQTVYKSATS